MNSSNFKRFLPSRFVIAFVIIPVIALIVFLVLRNMTFSPVVKKEMAREKFVEILRDEVKYKDSDNDGLKD
jgi:hypothetical protein